MTHEHQLVLLGFLSGILAVGIFKYLKHQYIRLHLTIIDATGRGGERKDSCLHNLRLFYNLDDDELATEMSIKAMSFLTRYCKKRIITVVDHGENMEVNIQL